MSATGDAPVDLAEIVGATAVRAARLGDEVDGVQPGRVIEPPTPETLAAVLAWCSARRQSVVLRGGGTKMAWGRRPGSIDVVVSTRGLSGVTRYEPGDLTVTVQAGTALTDLDRELARHRQWLPFDARDDQATVGGTIATNDTGPLRHRYGTPADQLIGIRLALPDGRLAVAGGNVVKNVAGYDLGKLVTGSFGSLAAVVSATFKLAPVPAVLGSQVFAFAERDGLAGAAATIAESQLDPLSVEVDALIAGAAEGHRRQLRLLVRFAGTATVIDDQMREAERLVSQYAAENRERVSGDEDATLWRDRSRRMWATPGTVVKASWMPASLPRLLELVDSIGRAGADGVELAGRAAVGTGLIRIAGAAAAQVSAVERLRAEPDRVGHVVVVRTAPDVKAQVDVWGLAKSTEAVSRVLKQALDPVGILNAARGPA